MLKDYQKQVTYWKESALHDWKTVESLWNSKRYDACLFYCHLVLEKLLKGLIVEKTKSHPPFIHDLVELLNRAGIITDQETVEKLAVFTSFNLRCRYDKDKMAFYKITNKKFSQPYFNEAKNLIIWLKKLYLTKK